MKDLNKKLYHNLKVDAIEIRNCITTYIKYIIAATTFTGLFSYLIDFEKPTVTKLYLIIFVLISITFLFEIIWYKFKSHNRYVGYMQLLTQEQDYILLDNLTQKELDGKEYIEKYQDPKLKKKYCTDTKKIGLRKLGIYDVTIK